ncbi:glycosyltransferase [Leptospira santarosai]|uniref:Glycosyltransferase, group 1 family protein n=5 Tax=Leptospira santarosai TaxID=28183 RepID=M6UH55_9LEPT|nr:glycosyltransferase [Leptospira santarosai]EMO58007.1 glycosyltransferase, group 1 family protein [Leptospira santarosai str. CBC1416]ASV11650.1 glycosyltransferase family 4 protein [Leptospira santarosai]AVV80287.1 Glycosyltransferase, group 1 family protein [Leptospira santarosai]EKO35056.1 glycosyltransferase, group 1 family protein [Leptospira santarosai str. MOR084]EKR89859.1 glycosyltransferase, group 1 family protein [Leptospira santarosai str. CBC379]
MRVLYFSDTFLPKVDGVAISMKNFADLLAKRGHTFTICCPKYGEEDFYHIGDSIRIERFRSGYLPSYSDIKVVLPSPTKIKRVIKEFEPDLVHIHTPGLLGLYGINATEKYGIPTIGTYHTLMSEQDMYLSFYRLLKLDKLFLKVSKSDKKLKMKDLGKIEKFDKFNIRKKIILKISNNIYERCDLIISPSHLIEKQLREFGLKTKIAVVSNGLDLTSFKGSIKQSTSAPKLLHVGRISYEKNCDVILNAFKLIHDEIPDSTLTIIGDGPALPSLKVQAQNLGVENFVTFTGFIKREQLPEEYPKYDLFLTASTMETQGLVILESIACGLPAVGVDSFAIPELIHDGRNGYIAKPFDVKGIAEKAVAILKDPPLYEKFSKESIKISKAHEMTACVDKMEEVYRTVASVKNKKKRNTLINMLFSLPDPLDQFLRYFE